MTPGHRPSEEPMCPCCAQEAAGATDDADQYAAHQAWLTTTIDAFGWAVQAVLSDGPSSPAYAYTIGLQGFDCHPELMISGLHPNRSAEILNVLGEQVRRRDRLRADQRLVLGPRLIVHLQAVTPLASDLLLLGANARYRDPDGPAVPALQAVWADSTGFLPWEREWSLGSTQPLATMPPPGVDIGDTRVWHIPGVAARRSVRRSHLPRQRRPPRHR